MGALLDTKSVYWSLKNFYGFDQDNADIIVRMAIRNGSIGFNDEELGSIRLVYVPQTGVANRDYFRFDD